MILDEILAHKRQEVAERESVRPLAELAAAVEAKLAELGAAVDANLAELGAAVDAKLVDRSAAVDANTAAATASAAAPKPLAGVRPRSFEEALRQPGVSFIAEIKRKSPSGGELRPGASAADLARMYAANGAAAVSVLTDARYFGGSDADLVEARAASGLPALRKDFVVSRYQLYEARLMGADAVLLIVRALSARDLRELIQLAHRLDLAAVVEAHSADEVERAVEAGARIVGVNNRDLDTLTTDVSLAPRLRPMVPRECVFVAESGISQPEQIAILREAGVDAVLIGESLLRSPHPGHALRTLVAAGQPLSPAARGRA